MAMNDNSKDELLYFIAFFAGRILEALRDQMKQFHS